MIGTAPELGVDRVGALARALVARRVLLVDEAQDVPELVDRDVLHAAPVRGAVRVEAEVHARVVVVRAAERRACPRTRGAARARVVGALMA